MQNASQLDCHLWYTATYGGKLIFRNPIRVIRNGNP